MLYLVKVAKSLDLAVDAEFRTHPMELTVSLKYLEANGDTGIAGGRSEVTVLRKRKVWICFAGIHDNNQ